jgi:hypothetical protein
VNNAPCSPNNTVVYGHCSCCPSRSGVAMIEFFLTTVRLLRGMTSACKRASDFRSLTFLVLVTLLGGTISTAWRKGGA